MLLAVEHQCSTAPNNVYQLLVLRQRVRAGFIRLATLGTGSSKPEPIYRRKSYVYKMICNLVKRSCLWRRTIPVHLDACTKKLHSRVMLSTIPDTCFFQANCTVVLLLEKQIMQCI